MRKIFKTLGDAANAAVGTIGEATQALVGLVFPAPSTCRVCGRPISPSAGVRGVRERRGFGRLAADVACPRCLGRVPRVIGPICERCGKPLRGASTDRRLCRDCVATPKLFAKARAVALYDGAAKQHVHMLKYQGRAVLAEVMGRLMAEVALCDNDYCDCELVVPVPMHRKKEELRGYNQAYLLAREVGSFLNIRVASALVRTTLTDPQSTLGKQGRSRNLRGVFEVPCPADVSGRRVLLVDDVFTTGSTASECTRALLRAGAREAYVLSYAIGVTEADWLTR